MLYYIQIHIMRTLSDFVKQRRKEVNLTQEEFAERAGVDENMGLNNKQIKGVYNRFMKNRTKAFGLIELSFLSIDMKRKYLSLLNARYDKLFSLL